MFNMFQVLNISVFQYLLCMPYLPLRLLVFPSSLLTQPLRHFILHLMWNFHYIVSLKWRRLNGEIKVSFYMLHANRRLLFSGMNNLSFQPLISNDQKTGNSNISTPYPQSVHQRCAQCLPISKSIKIHAIGTSTENRRN